MSKQVVIKVENLSKQYRLGTIGTGTLSHDLNRLWAKMRGKEDPYLKIGEKNDRTVISEVDYVWALSDINFEVNQGEVLGIIGRNGAGKSTLLKILSRITRPTTGSIKMRGRVGSLLEVGTGFHPDLTGRDNIYINGAILGMRKWEIDRKFDEIVDFSGVERYIDTPVKRYSSGMKVRLGFAVAAHLEPEILVVDEVLAVGDAEFQRKCLGKMNDVSKNEGRTILFVSHNMGAISSLCGRALLLNNGSIERVGEAPEVVKYYYTQDMSSSSKVNFEKLKVGNSECRLIEVAVHDKHGQYTDTIEINDEFYIDVIFDLAIESNDKFVVNFHFKTSFGEYLFVANQIGVVPRKKGRYLVTGKIPSRLLNSGVYGVGVAVTKYLPVGFDVCFYEESAVVINLFENMERSPDRYNYGRVTPGVIRPLLDWTEKRISE